MKKNALILFVSILLCISCEKDDNGQRISYYKNKIGEGYVFIKFKNDSIAPVKNAKIRIEFWAHSGMSGILSSRIKHSDYFNTDNNGKYSFIFLKRINEKKVGGCYIFPPAPVENYNGPIPNSGSIHFNYSSLEKSNKVFIDTIFLYVDRR